ncbi:MAG: 6-phosphogluconolactonase [Syntrophotaleaceae bacterium]
MTGPKDSGGIAAQNLRWHLFEDASDLAADACNRILLAAAETLLLRPRFRIALAGGSTPEPVYCLLSDAVRDWTGWEIYLTDERCLPADDPGRNSLMVLHALGGSASLPPRNFHPIPAERGAREGARLYASLIEEILPFDLVLLGLGEDGHTASLFPGHHHPPGELVHPVFAAPKPPPERVSLGAATLSLSRAVLVLACGEQKREAVAAWRRGKDLPIRHILPPCPIDVLLDRYAAGPDDVIPKT